MNTGLLLRQFLNCGLKPVEEQQQQQKQSVFFYKLQINNGSVGIFIFLFSQKQSWIVGLKIKKSTSG